MKSDTTGANPRSTASIAGHPLHPMLIPFPVAAFVGALVTDIAFVRAGDPFWFDTTQWLLGAGVVMALVAALAGFADFFGERRIRALRTAWLHMLGNLALVVLEAINLSIRAGNDHDTVAPLGLTLSAAGVLLLLFNGWQGWELVYRHRVGIAENGRPR